MPPPPPRAAPPPPRSAAAPPPAACCRSDGSVYPVGEAARGSRHEESNLEPCRQVRRQRRPSRRVVEVGGGSKTGEESSGEESSAAESSVNRCATAAQLSSASRRAVVGCLRRGWRKGRIAVWPPLRRRTPLVCLLTGPLTALLHLHLGAFAARCVSRLSRLESAAGRSSALGQQWGRLSSLALGLTHLHGTKPLLGFAPATVCTKAFSGPASYRGVPYGFRGVFRAAALRRYGAW